MIVPASTMNVPISHNPNVTRLGAISVSWEYVTKIIAESWLSANRRNRKFMPSLSLRYARDMKAGFWQTTHEGVAFDEDGNLVDGQHRLDGIAAANVGIWMLVTRGLPKSAIEVINRGKIRTLAHTLQIMGYEYSNHRMIASARRMFFGTEVHNVSNYISDSTLRRFIDANLEALIFATSAVTKTTAPAPVVAAVARAFYHADMDRLARFPVAMMDGIEKDSLLPGDQSARCLRRTVETSKHSAGANASAALYRKAQKAIRAYLDMTDLTKLHEISDDLFPLPKERLVAISTPDDSQEK